MDLNLVVLSGTLVAEPDYQEYPSGARRFECLLLIRTESDRKRTDTIRVKYWDPPAKLRRKKLKRGDRLWVAGTVQRRFWAVEGGRKSQHEIVASQIVYRAAELSVEGCVCDPDQNAGQVDDLAAHTT